MACSRVTFIFTLYCILRGLAHEDAESFLFQFTIQKYED